MRRKTSTLHGERGQILLMAVLLLTVILGLVGLVVDAGFWFVERRSVQNGADEATLAAAYELSYGGSASDAIVAALENAAANGYNNDGVTNRVTVHIPPTEGVFAGDPDSIEVVVEDLDLPTFFIHVIVPSAGHVEARGVATVTGGGGGDPNSDPLPITLPSIACDDDGATVDGRVMDDEGYHRVGDIVSGTTDYGDAYFACDGDYYYLALFLNGPDAAAAGGGVANENVYAGCTSPGSPQVNGDEIRKLKGMITAIGADTFTLDHNGVIWTIKVDGSTAYQPPNLSSFSDLTVGMAVEVEGDILSANRVLATKIREKAETYCNAGSISGYHSIYNTGWADNAHTFEKLEKSDRARFLLTCDGVPVHDFVQDYLRQDGAGWASDTGGDGGVILLGPDQSASSLEFNLENPDITGWGDDPGENPLEQSPPFETSYPFYDSEYDGFVWEMIYEFRIPVSAYDGCSQVTFGLNDFAGSVGPLQGIHSSPAKVADGEFLQIEPFDVRLVE